MKYLQLDIRINSINQSINLFTLFKKIFPVLVIRFTISTIHVAAVWYTGRPTLKEAILNYSQDLHVYIYALSI